MAFESERVTVPVAALIFREHFSDSILQASSRYMRSMRVFFSEFTSLILTGVH
jgi:hypothetical protein